ncbi:MAG TPA: BACON domain-containing carbohydrate-binding protein, partial [Vicinamibacterales bacterium]|nr:BACON domain-containing carbohydrate-binding protein [Vicinamibacterales bacterium]
MSRYDLEFYLVGASQPFMTMPMGKPPIDTDGWVRVDFTTLLSPTPTPGVVYVARVSAVGPGGSGRSAQSNTFTFGTPACSFTVSPQSRSIPSAGGSSTFGVTAADGCDWTASTPTSWITITGGASGDGNGTVSLSVGGNTSTSQRSGSLTIAGESVTVTQAGQGCTYDVTPGQRTFQAGGGSSTFTVTAPAGCSWTATEQSSWITIDSGASDSGSGTVSFTVANYTGTAERTATMTVAGQTVDVVQQGLACAFDVTPTSRTLTAGTGTSNFSVSAPAGCTWTATEQISWLTITSGTNGNGTGTVNFSVIAHTGTSQRSGTLTIAGEQVTVTQAGSGTTCNYSVTPTSRSVPAAGGSSTFSVEAPSGCSWTATEQTSWITITGGANGNGNGTVTFTATSNGGTPQRNASMTIAGEQVTVSQPGTSCTFTVDPSGLSVRREGGRVRINVKNSTDCAWTASETA